MKIVWERSVYGGNVPIRCVICEEWITPRREHRGQALLAIVYNQQDKFYGEACRHCATATPATLKSFLQERITQLKAKLQDLQDLNQGEIQVPSLEQEFQIYLD